jgi:hypothetical protein
MMPLGSRSPGLSSAPNGQLMVSAALGIIALGAAWILSGFVSNSDYNSLIYSMLLVAVAAITVFILRNWRAGFYVFLVWLLFEDLVRKYMGNDMRIYFAKDYLALITYVSLWAAVGQRRAMLLRPRFLFFFSLFFWIAVLQVLNPEIPSVWYGLLGLKLYFYYVPMMFVGYALIENEVDLNRFLFINMWLAIVISALGIAQSILGVRFLNPTTLAPDIKELASLHRTAPLSGAVIYRATSVFVSDARFASYLTMIWCLALGATAYLFLRGKVKGQNILFLAYGLIAIATFMSGGRGSVASVFENAAILVVASLWGAPWRWKQAHRLVRSIRRAVIASILAFTLIIVIFPKEIGARFAFYEETLSPYSSKNEFQKRVVNYTWDETAKAFAFPGFWTGHGTGTTSLGTQYVKRILGQARPKYMVEAGWGNLVIEMGVLGLVLWLCWSTALLVTMWRVAARLKETAYFPLAFAILLYSYSLLFPMTWGGLDLYENFVMNAYFWLLLGVFFRLPDLAKGQAANDPSRDPFYNRSATAHFPGDPG